MEVEKLYDPATEDAYAQAWKDALVTPWKISGLQILVDDETGENPVIAKGFNKDVTKHIVELHNWWLEKTADQRQKEGRRCEHRQCHGSHQCKLRRR
ncbi:MAG TPA: hypothetical protein VIY48_17505 [Candidatus Paceibacterota bacterium]